jgi:hypothetical protein
MVKSPLRGCTLLFVVIKSNETPSSCLNYECQVAFTIASYTCNLYLGCITRIQVGERSLEALLAATIIPAREQTPSRYGSQHHLWHLSLASATMTVEGPYRACIQISAVVS